MAPHLKWNETDTDKLVYRSVSAFLSLLFSLPRLWVYWFVPSEKAGLYSRWYLLPLRLGTLCGAPDPSCHRLPSALMTASLQKKETIFICIYSQTGIKKYGQEDLCRLFHSKYLSVHQIIECQSNPWKDLVVSYYYLLYPGGPSWFLFMFICIDLILFQFRHYLYLNIII